MSTRTPAFALANYNGVNGSAVSPMSEVNRRVLAFCRRARKAGLDERAASKYAWDRYLATGEMPKTDAEYAADLAAQFAA